MNVHIENDHFTFTGHGAEIGSRINIGSNPDSGIQRSISINLRHFSLISRLSVRIITPCKVSLVVAAVTRFACRGDLNLHF